MTGNVILHVQFRKRRGFLLFPAIDRLGGQQAMPLERFPAEVNLFVQMGIP